MPPGRRVVPARNHFPLPEPWAREAARRIGYPAPAAEALGHAYAIRSAVRANKRPKTAPPRPAAEGLLFGGDKVDVRYDEAGHRRGRPAADPTVLPGDRRPQIPAGYLGRLSEAFQKVLKGYPPRTLDGRIVYDL